jgi:GNAT superfamily N-acetyltransferase
MRLLTALERVSFAAWPAEEVADLDGWSLRFMHGVSRRANSVWTAGEPAPSPAPLADRIERVEAWYRERSIAPMFQVSELAWPRELDAALEARGYRREAPVSVQITRADCVPSVHDADVRVVVDRSVTPGWFDISAHQGRFAAAAETYRGLLERIGARGHYAFAEVGGRPAGVGLGVVDDGWMGVFSMLTLPPARRRGVGRAILAALSRRARESGAERMYLLVERANRAASALYRRASFDEVYGYHYRVR